MGIFSTKASDFVRNLYLKNRCEQQTSLPGQDYSPQIEKVPRGQHRETLGSYSKSHFHQAELSWRDVKVKGQSLVKTNFFHNSALAYELTNIKLALTWAVNAFKASVDAETTRRISKYNVKSRSGEAAIFLRTVNSPWPSRWAAKETFKVALSYSNRVYVYGGVPNRGWVSTADRQTSVRPCVYGVKSRTWGREREPWIGPSDGIFRRDEGAAYCFRFSRF